MKMLNFSFRKILRQVFFFLATGLLFGLYSSSIDLVFSGIEDRNYQYFYGLDYSIYFIVLIFLTLPFSLLYNWLQDYLTSFVSRKYVFLFGIFCGLLVGLLTAGAIRSHYLGDHRLIKNLLVFALVFVTLELIRWRFPPSRPADYL